MIEAHVPTLHALDMEWVFVLTGRVASCSASFFFRLVFLLACAIIALLFGIGNVLRLHYVGVNSVRIELLSLGDTFSPNRVAFGEIPGFYQN